MNYNLQKLRNIRLFTRFLFILILLFSNQILVAESKERLHLIHADLLENITDESGKSTQYLTGNVKFKKGDAILTSERAYYWRQEELGSFVDSVKMTRNEQVFTADSLLFDSKNDILTGFGNIHFSDGEYDLKADTLTYFLNPDSGIAKGNAHFVQRNQIVISKKLTYQKKEGDKAANYTAEGDVNITEGERETTCGKSRYDFQTETLILFEDPIVVENGQTLMGEEIQLIYQDEILSHVTITDKAHIIYNTEGKEEITEQVEDSTFTHQVTKEYINDMNGRRLEAFFTDGNLDSVRLEGMATTLYHIFEDSLYQGKNIASGDTITLFFEQDTSTVESDLTFINIVGGGRGEYRPNDASEDINAPIFYRADTINYTLRDQITTLSKSAQIEYENTKLVSGYVKVTWADNLLFALPSSRPQSTVDDKSLPTFYEKGRNPITGKSLLYDLVTNRGKILHGRTKMEDGYYIGDEISNRGNDEFFVKQGIYTTCDLDTNPHFHFESTKMKLITNDLIISKPLVLKLGGVPLFALPFGVFPDQGGRRHSGWIMPSYGESRISGQYLKGLGYYWALNQYWGIKFLLDFYDRQGIVFSNYNRYNKRYAYSGGLDFRYNRVIASDDISDIFGKPASIKWSIGWRHKQNLRYNQSLNVNAKYYSDNDFNRKLGINRSTRLNQNAVSRANYTKRWPKLKSSISLSLSQSRNLMTRNKINPESFYYVKPTKAGSNLVETTEVFPTATFRRGQDQLIKNPNKNSENRWYNNIYWSYGSTIKNSGKGYYESYFDGTQIDTIVTDDSLGVTKYDTTDQFAWGNQQHVYKSNWIHNANISSPQKIFKYLTINPNFTYKEEWINSYFIADSADSVGNAVNKREVQGFKARRTGTFSLSANTKIYGLFPINIAKLKAIRHTMTPSIGFSFQPDYSKQLFGYDFGYFKTLKDTLGNEYLFDPFSGTPIGATSRQERRSMTMSLKNVFQAKIINGEKEKKVNFLTWGMNSSYNFAAEEFKFAKLRSSVRASILKKLSLDFSMTHDFYRLRFEDGTTKRVNQFNTNKQGIPIPRLEQISAATGFRFSGNHFNITHDTTVVDTALQDTTFEDDLIKPSIGISSKKEKTLGGKKLWNARVSLRYSVNRNNPNNILKTFWMNTGLNLNVTSKWRVQYSARFDLIEKKMVSQDFNIQRDLHCWELNFTWTPTGFGRGFYLRISVKSRALQDLKVESRAGRWDFPGI